jgi:hypothetical protein
VGGACDTHGREEKSVKGFVEEGKKERDQSEDRGVDGRMIADWILGIIGWGCGVDSAGSG